MENQTQTLTELRSSLKEIDMMRRVKDVTDAERDVLEQAAVALRDAERILIAKIQSQFIKDMEKETAALNQQAKDIRSRVTKMNKMPNKVLAEIQTVLKTVVKILIAVAKW